MVDSGRPQHMKQFKNTRHAIETIYQQGGVRAFYKVCDENFESATGKRICNSRGCFLIYLDRRVVRWF